MAKEHYVTKMKRDIKTMWVAIWEAKAAVTGQYQCPYPYNDCIGDEETIRVLDADGLKQLIEDLPLPGVTDS